MEQVAIASTGLSLPPSISGMTRLGLPPSAILGMNPIWCNLTQSLVYIDIIGCAVYSVNLSSNKLLIMRFAQKIGFAIPSRRTSASHIILIVGLENKVVEVDMLANTVLRTIALVPSGFYKIGMRFNGGKCSPDGELFLSYISDQRGDNNGFLLRLCPQQDHHSESNHSRPTEGASYPTMMNLADRIILFSNSLSLNFYSRNSKSSYSQSSSTGSPNDEPLCCYVLKSVLPQSDSVSSPSGTPWINNNVMFFIDSSKGEIRRLVFVADQIENGHRIVESSKVVYTLPLEDMRRGHRMEGMTIDCKFKLWVALNGAGCILRIDPWKESEISRLSLDDAPCPTSCCFGGPELNVLYVTTMNSSPTELLPTGAVIAITMSEGISGLQEAAPFDESFLSSHRMVGGGEATPDIESNCMHYCCGLTLGD